MDYSAAGVLEVQGLAGIVQAQGADLVLGDDGIRASCQDIGSGELVEVNPSFCIDWVHPAADVLKNPVFETNFNRTGVVQFDPFSSREHSLIGAVSIGHHLVDTYSRAVRGAAGGASEKCRFIEPINQDW